jgi:hypothetical protein
MTTMLIDTNPTPSGDSIPSSKPDGVDPGSEVMTDQISKALRAAVLLNRHQDEIAAVWTEMADNLPEGQLTEQTLPRPSSGCIASREGFDPWDEFRLLTSEDSGCIMPLMGSENE